MVVRGVHRRLFVIVTLVGGLLSGCNLSEPEPVEPEPAEDLTDLQQSELPDECLVGHWTVTTGDLDIFIATLVPVPGLRVTDGSVYVDFTWDGNYVYASDGFVLRIDLGPDKYLQGSAAFQTSGIYTTESGSLVLHDSGSVKQITEWKAVKDGVAVVAPGAGPEISLVPDGPLPYQCGTEELVLDWMGAYGAVPMIFKRQTP